MSRPKVALLALLVASGLAATFWPSAASPAPVSVSLTPPEILADGYSTSIVTIRSESKPAVSVQGARVGPAMRNSDGTWRAVVRAGVAPGTLTVRVGTASAALTLRGDPTDRESDGMPDALELDTPRDQQAFRRWFTFLAEAQYFQKDSERPAEINDCAALIRYAYREALRSHDAGWAGESNLPLVLANDPVEKYQYPHTLLGASLFRVKPGPFAMQDLTSGAFSQFADAQTLRRLNSHFVSRDLNRAEPGDLLFFHQEAADMPFHAMIYLGPSQIHDDGQPYLIYHTGPDGADPGEIRRPSVRGLLDHPNPQWRPLAGNPAFLGVYRWNILPQ